jgi:Dolichyl-phosphate-mannose-protein mannosyltransferase
MEIESRGRGASAWSNPRGRRVVEVALAILCFSLIAAGLQIRSGCYRAELAAYPDEPAHATTGLAFEQYLVHGFPESPRRFLLDYYRHYPKVAIGHWPPLLYLFEAAAMLVFSPSKYALLGLEALFAGMLAWLVFRELKPQVGTVAAAMGGVVLLWNRSIVQYTGMAMAEILLTLTMFAACLAFARFVELRRTRDAIWFGLWVSAAILTKGTGWALLMLPPVVCLAAKDWKLPFERALWGAAAIIMVLCLPWQIVSLRLMQNGWVQGGMDYTLAAAPEATKLLVALPGLVIGAAAILGAGHTAIGGWKGGRGRPYWITLTGFAGASLLFQIVVPTGVESRKLLTAVPALFVLAAAGAQLLARWLYPARQFKMAGVLFCAVALVTLLLSLPIEAKPRLGFAAVAEALDRLLPRESAALLICDATAEGAIISEFALRHPQPQVYLVRGTKLMSSQDWNGKHYQRLIRSPEQCERLLESIPIGVVLIDRNKFAVHREAFDMVEAMLQAHASEWALAEQFAMPLNSRYSIAIYRMTRGIEPVRDLPGWIVPRLIDTNATPKHPH